DECKSKPGPAQADHGSLERFLGYEIAESHGDERREDIGHRGAVGRDRAVVPFRIADPGVQRAADEHLPFAARHRSRRRRTTDARGPAACYSTQLSLRRSAAKPANAALSMTLILPHMPSWPTLQNSSQGIRRSPGVSQRAP